MGLRRDTIPSRMPFTGAACPPPPLPASLSASHTCDLQRTPEGYSVCLAQAQKAKIARSSHLHKVAQCQRVTAQESRSSTLWLWRYKVWGVISTPELPWRSEQAEASPEMHLCPSSPCPCPPPSTPSPASPRRVSLINCLPCPLSQGPFLGNYLDGGLLLIIPYLGNMMRMIMGFYTGKLIYTYMFMYAIAAVTGNRNVKEWGTDITIYEDHINLK